MYITGKPNCSCTTQAGRQNELSAELNMTYVGTVPASGNDITLGTLALTVNGETAADVAAAITHIYMNLVSFNGSTLEAGVATTSDSKGYITRLTWYNSDGTEGGHWFVFVP